MNSYITKEACVNNFIEAKFNFEKGADRVELCDNLHGGGTTPSYGTIKQTQILAQKLEKLVVVMIRPRSGNFVYDREELDIMFDDIDICKSLGIQQIVTGVLTKDNEIDLDVMSEIINRAEPMSVIFHMAFDEIKNYREGFEQLIQLKIKRVLTKGGHGSKSAHEGKEHLKQWIQEFGSKIEILPGGGVTHQNYETLCQEIKTNQVHGTKIVDFC